VDLGNDITLCPNETATLTAPVSVDPSVQYFYTWQDGSTNQTYEAVQSGTYSVSIETSVGACIKSDTIVVDIINNQPNLGPDVFICENEEQTLNADLNNADVIYEWQDGSTAPSFTAYESGIYWVEVTNMFTECKFRDTTLVNKIEISLLDDPDLVICDGEETLLDFTIENSNDQVSYLWQDGSTQPTFMVEESGDYEVEINIDGCIKTQSVSVEIYPPLPILDLGVDQRLCSGESVLLEVPNDGNEYEWQDGSIGNSFLVDETGEYVVKVSNACGTAEDKIQIEFSSSAAVENPLLMPSSFTPNGDGLNDLFKPMVEGEVIDYQFSVFSRWGLRFYSTQNIEEGWDGFYENTPTEMGVYIWVCQARVIDCQGNQKDVVLKGNVTLIR